MSKKNRLVASILMLIVFLSGSLMFQLQVRAAATIHVDDDNVSGPWDGTPEHPYQNITSGMLGAVDGDTVFVHKGTYNEHVIVGKSVSLIGEERDTTIIDGGGIGTVVRILANNVKMFNFTVDNTSEVGVSIVSQNSVIAHNFIHFTKWGITLFQSTANSIYQNAIKENDYGVMLEESSGNTFYHNNFGNYIANNVSTDGLVNTWHGGYPQCGNWWSNHDKTDVKSGPKQDISGSDGICDKPFVINGSNIDKYPLVDEVLLTNTLTIEGLDGPSTGSSIPFGTYSCPSTLSRVIVTAANRTESCDWHTFDHWGLDSASYYYSATIEFSMSSDHEARAVWQPLMQLEEKLINLAIWAPQPGKPWMKTVIATGETNPLVPVWARVHRLDAVGGAVLVYVTWDVITGKGHIEGLGYAIQLMDPGDDLYLGPVDVAGIAPAVGMYDLYLKPYVLSDNAINTIVGGAQDYHAGYFYMLGYCDLNGDNVVDGKDYVLVKKAVGSLPGGAKWNWAADINSSNSVTVSDYQLVKTKIPTVYTPA